EFGRAAGGADFGGALQVVQPGEVALGLQGGVSGRGDVVAELVVVVEALVVNQAVNVGAAGAAELGAIRRRRAAVFANRFAPRLRCLEERRQSCRRARFIGGRIAAAPVE